MLTNVKELLLKELPSVEGLTTEQRHNPSTWAVAYVKGKNNEGSFQYDWEYRHTVADVLNHGGTIVVTLPYNNNMPIKVVRCEDEEHVLHWQLEQLEYLVTKYAKINSQFYKDLGNSIFRGINHARMFYQGTAWEAMKKAVNRYTILDGAYKEAVAYFEEQRQVNLLSWAEQQRLASLWTQAAKTRIFKQDIILDLPNQDVTAPITVVSDKAKINEYDKMLKRSSKTVYWKNKRKEITTYADYIEARIVNAWFYNQEEFRKPSQDELAKELEELREWFEQYKYHARRNKVAKPNQLTVLKYERLEQLEIEVGTYLNDRLATTKLYG